MFGLISIGSNVMKKNNPGICGPSASINRQSFASESFIFLRCVSIISPYTFTSSKSFLYFVF